MSEEPSDREVEMEVVQAVQAKHSVSNDEPELDHTLNTKATPAPLTSAITPAQMDELKHSSPLSDSFTEVMPSAFPSFFSASVPSLPTIESSVFSDPSPIYGTMPQQQASKQLDNQSVVSDNLGRQGSLEGGPQMFAINNAPDEAGNLSDSSAQSVPDDRVSSSTPAVLISGNGDREVPQSENHHDPVQVPPAGDGLVVPAQSSADQAARDANSTSHGPSSVDHSPRAAASSSISNVPVGADDPSTGLDPVLPGQALPRSRLAHDIVGILEDRIREDPKGDLAAWKGLILEHERRERLEEARAVFERFLKLVPTASEQWIAYAQMELQANEFVKVENIFTRALLMVPKVAFWSLYLDYVRRRNNLSADPSGKARTTVSLAYEFALTTVGIDYESGPLWRDYLTFLRDGTGAVGGNSWQDQQKMDLLRKAYQRAVCIPVQGVDQFWKEYDSFEMGLNKQTGRKFLQERSPAYMTARGAFMKYNADFRGIDRSASPTLPPAPGFQGYEEYQQQVRLWMAWITWEKEDPLVLKDDEPSTFVTRIVFVYKQAVMSLRYWPQMWVDAADYCFENGTADDGMDFLKRGISANPESCLLTFRLAERVEMLLSRGDGDAEIKRQGALVRAPYDALLNCLYDHLDRQKSKHAAAVQAVSLQAISNPPSPHRPEETFQQSHRDTEEQPKLSEDRSARILQLLKEGFDAQNRITCRVITFVWIALLRAMRRVQGKGSVNSEVGGCRQIFSDARKRGRVTSEIYVASALIEWHCYKDPAGTKIFERGMKLFPADGPFAIEYLKHLISLNDVTNARVVFETSAPKLDREAAKPLYKLFHSFESHFGDLTQIRNIEERMAKLYPENPSLSYFSDRFSSADFDPSAAQIIISPNTQARPKAIPNGISSADEFGGGNHLSPNSPKRSLPSDLSDREDERPRKFARSDSPLKGAAGKRVEQLKRSRPAHDSTPPLRSPTSRMAALHQPISSFASCQQLIKLVRDLPKAELYDLPRFNPEKVCALVQGTNL